MEDRIPDEFEMVLIMGFANRLSLLLENDLETVRFLDPLAASGSPQITLAEVKILTESSSPTENYKPGDTLGFMLSRVNTLSENDPACQAILAEMRERNIPAFAIGTVSFRLNRGLLELRPGNTETVNAFQHAMANLGFPDPDLEE